MNELSNEKLVSVKELAEVLGVSDRTIREVAKNKGLEGTFLPFKTAGGVQKKRVFNEKQATAIKLEIQGHHNLQTRQIDKVSTDYEMELMTQKVLQYHIEKANEYRIKAEQAEKKLEIQKPKVEFANAVMKSPDVIDMAEVAKVLNLGIGRNNLFKLLRDKKILNDDNEPYQKYVDAGYFKLIENKFETQDEVKINLKTVVYQKGLKFIRKLIVQNNENLLFDF